MIIFFHITSIDSVMPSSHLILCYPLLLLPPIPPSIRVFSNESILHMRWPKYWVQLFLIMQLFSSVSSLVAQSCLTLCDPMDCSTPGFHVHHQLPELTQTHVHWIGDAIQPSHPLSSPSPPTFNLPQHQAVFKWVGYLCQVAKGLEFQLQHQSFQWIFRTDFLSQWF